jgi:O-antigen/teichoic acid export membrane protein
VDLAMSVEQELAPSSLTGIGGRLNLLIDQCGDILKAGDKRALAQRTAIFSFLIRVASAAVAYLMQVALARWMGSYEYGIFVFVWVWVIIIGTLSSFGFNTSVLRFIPEYTEQQDPARLRGFLFAGRWLPVGLATLIALLGIAGVYFLGDWIEQVYVLPVYLALVCLPLYTLTDIQDSIARAYSWPGIALIPPYLVRPFLILAFMALAIYGLGRGADAATATAAAIGATWLAGLLQLLFLKRKLAPKVPNVRKKMDLGFWVRISTPFVLVEGFYILLAHTDILILALYLPPDQVAIYFAALKTIGLVSFVAFAVTAGVTHRFAELNAAGDAEGLSAFMRDAVKWTFWPSVAAAIAVLAVGYPLLMLFGPEFTAGYEIMFILALGILARAAVGPVESLLNMLGHQIVCAKVLIGAVALNIAANFALVPYFGLAGAAAATSFAIIAETIFLYGIANRLVGINVLAWSKPSKEGGAE